MTDNEKFATEVMGWVKKYHKREAWYFKEVPAPDGFATKPIMPCSDFAPHTRIEQAMILREAMRKKENIS